MRLPFRRAKDSPDEHAPRPRRAPVGAEAGDNVVLQARTRARRRLVGAGVLLTLGVLGFPLLFETQPRPLPVDTPILVPAGPAFGSPGRVAMTPPARPLPVLPPDAGNESVAASIAASAPPPLHEAAPAPAKPAAKSEPSAKSEPAPKPEPKPAAKPAPAPRTAEATPAKPAAAGRFVVQVGAYNDLERMLAARQKLEKMGYKTYIQDVDTPSGKRTRVRVGPFGSRPEAEAVAAKVKASGMQANIYAL